MIGKLLMEGSSAKAGDVGPEDLPSRVRMDMSDCDLEEFLEKQGLKPYGPASTLKDRAWRL